MTAKRSMGLLARQRVDALLSNSESHAGGRLKRSLRAVDLVLLGVGAIIGAGIFTTIGTAAAGDALRPGAGPSLMLSFVITAITCGFTALCYAELAAMVPVSGSAYTYTYAAMGELIAWIIGWDLMLEYAISNVAVAVSWANYFRVFLHGIGIDVPWWLAIDYRTAAGTAGLLEKAPHVLGIPIVLNLLAFSVTAFLTLLLVWGIRESARFNGVMVVIKVIVLLFFIGVALSYIPPHVMMDNWQPFFPHGVKGTFSGAAIVFFAYIGFDTVSTVAEETHNPGRTLPIGILASLIICTILYVLVAGVFTGVVPQATMQEQLAAVQGEPLALALSYVAPHAPWITTVVALGAVIAQTVTLLVYQMGQPRIFFSMARDGLLPPLFAAVHPKFKTPHVTTWLTGIMVAVASTFTNIDELIDLTNIGTLFAFTLVCLGIPILRYTHAQHQRPFQVPLGPYFLPILGAGSCLFLMCFLPSSSWWRFFGWLSLGLAVYTWYAYPNSLLGKHEGFARERTCGVHATGVACLLITLGLFMLPQNTDLLDMWQQEAYWGIGCLLSGLIFLALIGLRRIV